MSDELGVRWIHGSANCTTNPDPLFEVYVLDTSTYILRQIKCHNFEVPFLYLLFGRDRALLLDTGVDPGRRLHEIVRDVADRRTEEGGGRAVPLVVAHPHSHGDHVTGDDRFAADPDATILPPTLAGLTHAFGLSDWPNRTGRLDVGALPRRDPGARAPADAHRPLRPDRAAPADRRHPAGR